MKRNIVLTGILALALVFGLTFTACGGKKGGGGSSGGSSDSSGSSSGGGSGGSSSSGGGGSSSGRAAAGKEAKETDFIYELNSAGDGVVITGYQRDAAGGALVIPATIEGYPVVAVIYDYRHGFGGSITSIVFPDSITEIRPVPSPGGVTQYFFNYNTALTSITFPKNLKVIPQSFALGCENLTTVRWPEALEQIGGGQAEGAFQGAGFTELVIPEGVREIGEGAFWDCKNLTSVTIPNSVETIGQLAFADCPLLTTVTMPSHTIRYPGSIGAFRGNPKLTGIAARKAITDTGYKGEF